MGKGYKEPRQAKVVYVNAIMDEKNEIIKIESSEDTVYLNDKMYLAIKFNDLDFDTNNLRIFVSEYSPNPLTYKEFRDNYLEDGLFKPKENNEIVITDSNYDIKCSINIYNI